MSHYTEYINQGYHILGYYNPTALPETLL